MYYWSIEVLSGFSRTTNWLFESKVMPVKENYSKSSNFDDDDNNDIVVERPNVFTYIFHFGFFPSINVFGQIIYRASGEYYDESLNSFI